MTAASYRGCMTWEPEAGKDAALLASLLGRNRIDEIAVVTDAKV